jgi:hypothetical protein
MTYQISLDFKPESYFGPQSLQEHFISHIKGAVVKDQLESMQKENRHDEIEYLIETDSNANESLKALGSVHPMFMGGNYLPDMKENEVEIARIVIASTTFDVTSLYARFEDGKIHYRVVDEYEGDTLFGLSEVTSEEPLTLGEMTNFFLGVWSLIDVLEMNFEDDLESALGFFNAQSDFYSDFDRLCRVRVIAAFPDQSTDEDEDCENG